MLPLEAEEILEYLIELLLGYLEELSVADSTNAFICGEQVAYTECLEMIQLWKYADEFGLNFDIEKKFPLF